MKIIGTMKYFQTSLVQIASTATSKEKQKIKKLTFQFLVQYDYFENVWLTLTAKVKKVFFLTVQVWKKY